MVYVFNLNIYVLKCSIFIGMEVIKISYVYCFIFSICFLIIFVLIFIENYNLIYINIFIMLIGGVIVLFLSLFII